MREELEEFFGVDLRDVRVHQGPVRRLFGHDAVAGGGRIYVDPALDQDGWGSATAGLDAQDGRYLLAHEVTHLIQQAGGRVTPEPGRGPLTLDPTLEREAVRNGELFGAIPWAGGNRAPARAVAPPGVCALHPEGSCQVLQPVVTIFPTLHAKKGVTYSSKNFASLWQRVKSCQHYKKQKPTLKEADLVKKKLEHWVKAPPKASYVSLRQKGHDKKFLSVDNLSRALFGRVRSKEAKQLEAQFSGLIDADKQVNKLLRAGTAQIHAFHKANLVNFNNVIAELVDDRGSKARFGRYADFYSKTLSKLRYLPTFKSKEWAKPRAYVEGFAYIEKSHNVPNYQIAAFLADYSMVARWYFEKHLDGFFDETAANDSALKDAIKEAGKKQQVIDAAEDDAAKDLLEQIKGEGFSGYDDFAKDKKRAKLADEIYVDLVGRYLEVRAKQYANQHMQDFIKGRVDAYKEKQRSDWFMRFKHSEARSPLHSHSNVNESDDWVLRAREKRVRLGAGPSATTMQVLQMFQIVYPHNETKLAVCLALFNFWNKYMSKKQSEIHTWHEVMTVARDYCADQLLLPGELEYPTLEALKRWLKDPLRTKTITLHESKLIQNKLAEEDRKLQEEEARQLKLAMGQQVRDLEWNQKMQNKVANLPPNPLQTKRQRRNFKVDHGALKGPSKKG